MNAEQRLQFEPKVNGDLVEVVQKCLSILPPKLPFSAP